MTNEILAPSGCSKSSSSSLHDFSRGRSKSQRPSSTFGKGGQHYDQIWTARMNASRTLAMTILSDRLFETSFAISIGLVSQLFAFRSDPSGIVTVISSLGCAIKFDGQHVQLESNTREDIPATNASCSALSSLKIFSR